MSKSLQTRYLGKLLAIAWLGTLPAIPAFGQVFCESTYTPRHPLMAQPAVWEILASQELFFTVGGSIAFNADGAAGDEILAIPPFGGTHLAIGYRTASSSFEIVDHGREVRTQSLAVSYAGPLDANAPPKILSGSGGRLIKVDAPSRRADVVAHLNATLAGARAFDMDRDGVLDVVSGGLVVMNSSLTEIKGRSDLQGFGRFVLGNFDADAEVEIAGESGFIYGYANDTFHLEGQLFQFSSSDVFIGNIDVDDDGIDEIVYTLDGFTVNAYSHRDQRIVWSVPSQTSQSGHSIEALATSDVDNDGIVDVLILQAGAPGNPGELQALDGRNGAVLWRIAHPDGSGAEILVADVDGDGERELVFGTIRDFTGPDTLWVYDLATRSLEWSSVQESGRALGLSVADIDSDARPEIVWAPQGLRNRTDGKVYFRSGDDLSHDSPALMTQLPGPIAAGIHSLLVADVLGDGDPELLIGTDDSFEARIYIYSLPDRTLVRTMSLGGGTSVTSLATADVDADGDVELIAATGATTTGGGGASVRALDPSTSTTLWNTPVASLIFSKVNGLRVSDLDGDGRDEIVATSDGLSIIDEAGTAVAQIADTRYFGVDVLQVTGDSRPEIVAGTEGGLLRVMSSLNLAPISELPACNGPIHAVARHVLGPAGSHQVLFTCDWKIWLADFDLGSIVPVTGHIGPETGYQNRLMTYQSQPGQHRLLVNSRDGVHVLAPTPNLRPTVTPGNPCTGTGFGTHWRSGFFAEIEHGDAGGDPLTLTVALAPDVGNLTLGTNGKPNQFRYDGGPSNRMQLLGIRAHDGTDESALTITGITLANDPPTLMAPLPINARVDEPAFGDLGAIDRNSDPLAFDVVQAPVRGTLTIFVTGEFRYTPTSAGSDTFTVRAFDQVDYSSAVTYQVNVSLPPPPPPPPPPQPPPSSGGGGGPAGPGAILMLLMLLAARRRKPSQLFSLLTGVLPR